MANKPQRLRRGDLVEVKSPDDILQTLDADGAVDHLPFMPEMVEFCGQRFRVAGRVEKTCFSGSMSTMLAFPSNDVVTLETPRCCGSAHGGCQKACTIFWRETWLRSVDDGHQVVRVDEESRQRLRSRLKTSTGPTTYFCQASELLKAARPLSRQERFVKCLSEVQDGNCSALEMAGRVSAWLAWRFRRTVRGANSTSRAASPDAERLNLVAGEPIEVKAIDEIRDTLNEAGRHRGLWFSPDMRRSCGARTQVMARVERIIVDGTGEMRQLKNTVSLEDSRCGCSQIAFGGCARNELNYWREIWLRRPAGQ